MSDYDLIEEYLVHSYLYYVRNDPVMDDESFDQMCVELTAKWTTLESPFKGEVDSEYDPIGMMDFQLKGQDGYEEDYSEEIKRIAMIRLSEHVEMLETWEIHNND